MKTVKLWSGKNNCQRCKLKCNGHLYVTGQGYGFPLILCKKCGREIRNGLIKALTPSPPKEERNKR